jgi:type IV pilus assembly protein PilQ
MKFERLLTVALIAVFCAGTAGTAMAASQLNSVQVTPKANTATVSLRTTGSFAHKEYRPDEHSVLVDLTGVTAGPAVERTVAVGSAVLKGYKLSDYTSGSGSEVTRIELTVGDGVSVEVSDKSDGLQILLSSRGAKILAPSAPASSVASPFGSAYAEPMVAAPKPVGDAAKLFHPVPEPAVPAAQTAATPQVVTPVRPTEPSATARSVAPTTIRSVQSVATPMRPAEPSAAVRSVGPMTIRSISVQPGHGTLDIVIEGPNNAHPFTLTNPDRLVLDFSNAVSRPSVRNIAVHTRDVLQVRVSRFQAEPPVTRVVIDLRGPRTFEVVPSATQVTVRVKTEDVGMLVPPLKPAPTPTLASAEAPTVAARLNPATFSLQNSPGAHVALASAPINPQAGVVPLPAADRPLPVPVRNHPIRDPKVRAGIAAEKMAAPTNGAQPTVEMARLNSSEQLSVNAMQASPATPKYTGEPISVNLKDVDLKDFFRLIHEISGLNIVLDPNVKGTVTLVLDDVPWDQALDIVLKNNALDRELQGNVLRIAATDTLRREAVDRRAQSEAVALAVDRQTISRFLSYAKAKDVVPTIKKFLTARGDVISDDRTNALIISDIPSVIPNLDRLISQLDRKSQEVEIEVRVVSATRSFSRDLGFQLGFNWGNGVSTIAGSNPNGSGSATSTATTTGTSTSTTTTPASAVPLFTSFTAPGATTGLSLSNITKSYGIDAVLTAAETHNLAKVLSRPRVVTQSNVKAEVKQGVKIPVYTASTSNANASVSYIDAVLRLSVTPQITSDNTIFLTVDVENTQPSGQINGNYILTTQQATTQVLVTDGGTVVIGGVIQTTNSVSVSQTPLLGDIPWLGNLFKQRSVSTETDELIFFITPKIIQT